MPEGTWTLHDVAPLSLGQQFALAATEGTFTLYDIAPLSVGQEFAAAAGAWSDQYWGPASWFFPAGAAQDATADITGLQTGIAELGDESVAGDAGVDVVGIETAPLQLGDESATGDALVTVAGLETGLLELGTAIATGEAELDPYLPHYYVRRPPSIRGSEERKSARARGRGLRTGVLELGVVSVAASAEARITGRRQRKAALGTVTVAADAQVSARGLCAAAVGLGRADATGDSQVSFARGLETAALPRNTGIEVTAEDNFTDEELIVLALVA